MTLGQCVYLSSLLDGEPSRSITSLQIFEPVDWNSTGSSGKLQQPRFLFGVPCSNNLPEVLDDLILFLVSTIIGMLFPIINIDVCYTTNEEFKFSFIKNVNKVRRDQLIEACDESVELFFDPFLDLPLRHESVSVSGISVQDAINILNIFPLAFVCHRNVTTSGLQVYRPRLTKLLVID